MVARGHDICAGSLGKFFAGLVMAAGVKTDLGKVGRALRFCGVLSGLHGNWVLNVPWENGRCVWEWYEYRLCTTTLDML